MSNDVSYVRKALIAAQNELILEITQWDPNIIEATALEIWQEKSSGLAGMMSRAAQETEMHRRQITVIKSEMQAFERSARATKILDLGASRSIAAQADLMEQDLSAATQILMDMEDGETRLKAASELAAAKISAARERLSSSGDQI